MSAFVSCDLATRVGPSGRPKLKGGIRVNRSCILGRRLRIAVHPWLTSQSSLRAVGS